MVYADKIFKLALVVTIFFKDLNSKPAFICEDSIFHEDWQCTCKVNNSKVDLGNGRYKCAECTPCESGFGRSYSCDSDEAVHVDDMSCAKCGDNEYTFHGECQKCRDECDIENNEYEYTSCIGNTNRECRCTKEFYHDLSSNKCTLKCSKCVSNEPEERVRSGQCLLMPENMRCRDSGSGTLLPSTSPTFHTTLKTESLSTTTDAYIHKDTTIHKDNTIPPLKYHPSNSKLILGLGLGSALLFVAVVIVVLCRRRIRAKRYKSHSTSSTEEIQLVQLKRTSDVNFIDFATDAVICELGLKLDNHKFADKIRRKICKAVFYETADSFIFLMKTSEQLLCNIRTKKPEYLVNSFIKVLKNVGRLDVVEEVQRLLVERDERSYDTVINVDV